MRPSSALVALIALCALEAHAAALDRVVLTVPRALRAGEQATVAVSVGPIGRSRIEVATAQGQRLGTISPFGPAAGRAGGTYLLPVPSGAIREGRLDLRFTLTNGAERRSPTSEEVTGVRLSLPGD